jgi:hypothetical protein
VTVKKNAIDSRNLMPLLTFNDGGKVIAENWPRRRAELLALLSDNLYGWTPAPPPSVRGEVTTEQTDAYAGKVTERHVVISFTTPSGECSFPIHLFIPNAGRPLPVFLHLAFRDTLPDKYVPVEEITDNGFALAVLCYQDAVNDNHFGDYSDGLAKHFIHGERKPDEWGKIGMWAYCASRVYDYLCTQPELDSGRVAVIGHSRLGKTALWTGAQDERFWAAISNNSGFGGAAIAKHGQGERVDDFRRCGSWDWFCPKFLSFIGSEDSLPYDQHMLLALIAPRLLAIGSAELDRGADPVSEFLSAYAASPVWDLLDRKGLVSPAELPKVGTSLTEGCIGYHLRAGRHFLSRADWGHYMAFLKRKMHTDQL